MKVLKQIFGKSPVEESKDVVAEWMHKSNQAYIYANTVDRKNLPFAHTRKWFDVSGSSNLPMETCWNGVPIQNLDEDQYAQMMIDISGSFQFSQSLVWDVPDMKVSRFEHRCPWCNRKYFETDSVCAGCGAPI